MIEHLVLFTAKEEASGEELADLVASLRTLREKVPGVVDLTAGENFSDRGGGFTHGLFARFESVEDLARYREHPEHLAVLEKLGRLTTNLIAVDYEA